MNLLIKASAIGKRSRVPYGSIARKEVSIVLHGINIPFKEVKMYKRFELEQIIEQQSVLSLQGMDLRKQCMNLRNQVRYTIIFFVLSYYLMILI